MANGPAAGMPMPEHLREGLNSVYLDSVSAVAQSGVAHEVVSDVRKAVAMTSALADATITAQVDDHIAATRSRLVLSALAAANTAARRCDEYAGGVDDALSLIVGEDR